MKRGLMRMWLRASDAESKKPVKERVCLSVQNQTIHRKSCFTSHLRSELYTDLSLYLATLGSSELLAFAWFIVQTNSEAPLICKDKCQLPDFTRTPAKGIIFLANDLTYVLTTDFIKILVCMSVNCQQSFSYSELLSSLVHFSIDPSTFV